MVLDFLRSCPISTTWNSWRRSPLESCGRKECSRSLPRYTKGKHIGEGPEQKDSWKSMDFAEFILNGALIELAHISSMNPAWGFPFLVGQKEIRKIKIKHPLVSPKFSLRILLHNNLNSSWIRKSLWLVWRSGFYYSLRNNFWHKMWSCGQSKLWCLQPVEKNPLKKSINITEKCFNRKWTWPTSEQW